MTDTFSNGNDKNLFNAMGKEEEDFFFITDCINDGFNVVWQSGKGMCFQLPDYLVDKFGFSAFGWPEDSNEATFKFAGSYQSLIEELKSVLSTWEELGAESED